MTEELNAYLESLRKAANQSHEERQKVIDQHVGMSASVVTGLAAMQIKELVQSPVFQP